MCDPNVMRTPFRRSYLVTVLSYSDRCCAHVRTTSRRSYFVTVLSYSDRCCAHVKSHTIFVDVAAERCVLNGFMLLCLQNCAFVPF